jgi:hypothetical protein
VNTDDTPRSFRHACYDCGRDSWAVEEHYDRTYPSGVRVRDVTFRCAVCWGGHYKLTGEQWDALLRADRAAAEGAQ